MGRLKKYLLKAASILRRKAKSLTKEDRDWYQLLADWKVNNQKYDYRHSYDLNPSSIVLDLGGYEGQWASDIFGRYGCRILIFEPVVSYATKIRERLKHHAKLEVYTCGLGAKTFDTSFHISADSTSQYIDGGQEVPVQIRSYQEFVAQNGIDQVDLMKINIEGGEYDLLEYLIETGEIKKIKELQIQFHHFIPDARDRMKKIQNGLSRTHGVTYQYEFLWENWRRK